jgi:spore cortex formation protein SpoVR/YcgB (stage V sporulation)
MNDINKQFEIVNEILDRIDAKQKEINEKLDEVIAALHAYDDENIEDINEGYGESSFESFMDSKDDILNWKVDGAERRTHHVTNEEADEDAATFNDYGMRVVDRGKDINNTQDNKHVGETKKRNKRKYYKPKQTK